MGAKGDPAFSGARGLQREKLESNVIIPEAGRGNRQAARRSYFNPSSSRACAAPSNVARSIPE